MDTACLVVPYALNAFVSGVWSRTWTSTVVTRFGAIQTSTFQCTRSGSHSSNSITQMESEETSGKKEPGMEKGDFRQKAAKSLLSRQYFQKQIRINQKDQRERPRKIRRYSSIRHCAFFLTTNLLFIPMNPIMDMTCPVCLPPKTPKISDPSFWWVGKVILPTPNPNPPYAVNASKSFLQNPRWPRSIGDYSTVFLFHTILFIINH